MQCHRCVLAGSAEVHGLSVEHDMAAIYGLMGVCPQHDLLWEQLTAREHLLFYARLKNLRVCPCMQHRAVAWYGVNQQPA